MEVRTQVWYNPDLISAYFNIPGVIGMILSFITAMLTATAVVRERERGTIEQLIVTPIRSWELILGKILPYVRARVCGRDRGADHRALLVRGARAGGPRPDPCSSRGCSPVSGLGIGLFASTIANTQQEALLVVMMTLLPSIFLSGFFFPIDAMPLSCSSSPMSFPCATTS